MHKTLNEIFKDTTERQYQMLWLPWLEQQGVIKFIKPKDPTKDGPPIVTKAMIEDVQKQAALARFKFPAQNKKR